MRTLGADEVIDYKSEDVTRRNVTFDVIFDTSGTAKFSAYRRILAPTGRLLSTDVKFGLIWAMLMGAIFGGKTAKIGISAPSSEDLESLARVVEKGGLRAVVDRSYTLDQIRDAHRRVEGPRRHGSVVVSILGEVGARPSPAKPPAVRP